MRGRLPAARAATARAAAARPMTTTVRPSTARARSTTLTDRLSAWAAAGYGAGELRLTPSGGSPFTADLTMVRVAREWSPDGAMRARVCWRVDKSLALMNGGYRELLKE